MHIPPPAQPLGGGSWLRSSKHTMPSLWGCTRLHPFSPLSLSLCSCCVFRRETTAPFCITLASLAWEVSEPVCDVFVLHLFPVPLHLVAELGTCVSMQALSEIAEMLYFTVHPARPQHVDVHRDSVDPVALGSLKPSWQHPGPSEVSSAEPAPHFASHKAAPCRCPGVGGKPRRRVAGLS